MFVGNMSYFIKHTGTGIYVGTNAILKGWKLFVYLGQFSCPWIRLRIHIFNPDPGEPDQFVRFHADPDP
jgi:hypothetical protein